LAIGQPGGGFYKVTNVMLVIMHFFLTLSHTKKEITAAGGLAFRVAHDFHPSRIPTNSSP
jgi:hypothetical protein